MAPFPPDLEVARVVEVAWPHAWEALARVEHWPAWGPNVTAVEPGIGEVAAGATGRLRLAFGGWVPFTVTSVEPGRRWTWRVGGVAATGHRVEPLGARTTRVVIEVPWWAAPYALVCRLALRRLARVAEGLSMR